MLTPVQHKKLSDDLAERIQSFILDGKFKAGTRLPTTAELMARFGGGYPTLREALKRLEAVGIVTIRHGSGIYVGDNLHNLFLLNPIASVKAPTRTLLLDLIDAREPIEVQSAGLAAERRTASQLTHLQALLRQANRHLEDDALLNRINIEFHIGIAEASGNAVLPEMLRVITSLFRQEQRMILQIYGSRTVDHEQHAKIFDAIQRRDRALSVQRMRSHLAGVRKAILHWKPAHGV